MRNALGSGNPLCDRLDRLKFITVSHVSIPNDHGPDYVPTANQESTPWERSSFSNFMHCIASHGWAHRPVLGGQPKTKQKSAQPGQAWLTACRRRLATGLAEVTSKLRQ